MKSFLTLFSLVALALSADLFFDARTVWPSCGWAIRNQGNCRGSWAHAIAGTIGHRFCIMNATHNPLALSALSLMVCSGSTKCDGTFDEAKINDTIQKNGLYRQACIPEELGNGTACPTSGCPVKNETNNTFVCINNRRLTNLDDIKAEIFANGSVVMMFEERGDLMSYYSGIYYYSTNKKTGNYEGVEVVGWGIENGINYWLGMDSFGEGYGESGTIRVGMNDVNNRTGFFYACLPQEKK